MLAAGCSSSGSSSNVSASEGAPSPAGSSAPLSPGSPSAGSGEYSPPESAFPSTPTPSTADTSPTPSPAGIPAYVRDVQAVACNDQLASLADAQRGSHFDAPFPASKALSVTTGRDTYSLVGTDPDHSGISQPLEVTTFRGDTQIDQRVIGERGPIAVAVYGKGERVVFSVPSISGTEPAQPIRGAFDEFTACREEVSKAGPLADQAAGDAQESEAALGFHHAKVYSIGPSGVIKEIAA